MTDDVPGNRSLLAGPRPDAVWRAAGALGAATGALAVAVGLAAGAAARSGPAAVAAGAVAAVCGLAAARADLRERRIPNAACAVAVLAAIAIGAVRAVVPGGSGGGFGPILAGGLGAAVPLFALHLVSPAGLGFGDVKFGAALGALLGVVHWSLGLAALGAASLVGLTGAAAVRAWRRSIPFGVCLAIAAPGVLAASSVLRDRWGPW